LFLFIAEDENTDNTVEEKHFNVKNSAIIFELRMCREIVNFVAMFYIRYSSHNGINFESFHVLIPSDFKNLKSVLFSISLLLTHLK